MKKPSETYKLWVEANRRAAERNEMAKLLRESHPIINDCPDCYGIGIKNNHPCPTCGGKKDESRE